MSSIPGLCNFCGHLKTLRTLPGSTYEGVCEPCDEVRHHVLYPRKRWVSWSERASIGKARSRQAVSVRSPRPVGQAAAVLKLVS